MKLIKKQKTKVKAIVFLLKTCLTLIILNEVLIADVADLEIMLHNFSKHSAY